MCPDGLDMRLNVFVSSVKRVTAVTSARKLYTQFISTSTLQSSLRMASTLPRSPIFDAIWKHNPKSLAIIHGGSDRSFCYGSLLHDVAAAKDALTGLANGNSLQGERIAFLAENGYDYVGAKRAFIPLCVQG